MRKLISLQSIGKLMTGSKLISGTENDEVIKKLDGARDEYLDTIRGEYMREIQERFFRERKQTEEIIKEMNRWEANKDKLNDHIESILSMIIEGDTVELSEDMVVRVDANGVVRLDHKTSHYRQDYIIELFTSCSIEELEERSEKILKSSGDRHHEELEKLFGILFL